MLLNSNRYSKPQPGANMFPIVRYFNDVESASNDQASRELQEALAVRQMNRADYSRWLNESWGRLQRQGVPALSLDGSEVIAGARCFHTLEEKNRFDDEAEIARVLSLAHRRGLL